MVRSDSPHPLNLAVFAAVNLLLFFRTAVIQGIPGVKVPGLGTNCPNQPTFRRAVGFAASFALPLPLPAIDMIISRG